ncbi:WD repeat-containing protein 89 isoform X2 [Bacillus rossius redtenbacheri]|uniref:WD repeat-containing protein 89 isoform X2 n=1 Tax=Bacillus rossius redtenbacheri TaxID=93214 RepID=UPI002FDD443C
MFDEESLANSLNVVSDSDDDACDSEELASLFTGQFELQAQTRVSKNNAYILHLCGATFSPKNDNLLYTCSMDGTVKLWDLRTDLTSCKTEFKDGTYGATGAPKPLTSFDVAPDDRFVCAGSQLVDGDAFLLFWDARSSKLLGGYWESHSEDVTQVCFHPLKQTTMATGSTDKLINIFDISASCEDDALLHTLNTESSVAKITWLGGEDSLSCITHTEDVQLWKTDGERPEVQFSRETVTKCLQRTSVDNCYLIDVHWKETSGQVMLLAGSLSRKGQCLRSLEVTNEKLKPMCQFLNNKEVVRTSWYLQNDERVITGGEAGYLNVWKQRQASNGHENNLPSKSSSMKMPSKFKQHKEFSKPYRLCS